MPHALLVDRGAGDLLEGEGGLGGFDEGGVVKLRYETANHAAELRLTRCISSPAISFMLLFFFRGRYDGGAQTIAQRIVAAENLAALLAPPRPK